MGRVGTHHGLPASMDTNATQQGGLMRFFSASRREDTRTTIESYVGEETDEQVKRRQALKVLQGGRS